MNKKKITSILSIAIIVALFIGVYSSDILDRIELRSSDKLYQEEQAIEGDTLLVGIDDTSLEEYGPFQTWNRSYFAKMIEALNADPDNRPAVIGIDVMFFGETDKEYDDELAKVCAKYNNIVVASYMKLKDGIIMNSDGTFDNEHQKLENYEEPYSALRNVTLQGYTNIVPDEDGIIRHTTKQASLPDGRVVHSFAYEIYRRFAKEYGLDEDVTIPENSHSQWYIPFTAKAGNYSDGISVADVLSGEVTGDMFAGSIVLIGPYAAGLMDNYMTSIDHSKLTNGVEIHANIIDALIRQNFKKYVPKQIQFILFAVVILLGAIVLPRIRFRFSIPIWIVTVAGYLVLCKVMYTKGYIMEVIYLPVAMTVLFVISIARRAIHYSREKHRVMDTFKRYVSPDVVDEIFKQGTDTLDLVGKTTDIACLFVDIRGFTSMSEKMKPEEVVEILNQYLSLTSECIFRYHGTLDKFIGDATMAIFNAPIPQEDYIYQAVRAAWDMVSGAEALNQEMMKRYHKTVQFGIGIHCGKAVVGNIGTKLRMDYTAIGDTVNTASRLESNANPGKIYISKAVCDALEGRIKVTSLGTDIKLKGKSENFEIFEIDEILA